jgi:hypothetical protein
VLAFQFEAMLHMARATRQPAGQRPAPLSSVYDSDSPARLVQFVEDIQRQVGPLEGAPQRRGAPPARARDADALVTPMRGMAIPDAPQPS